MFLCYFYLYLFPHFHTTFIKMSRWELLRSALKSGQRDADSQTSIHRFHGFQKLKKMKCLWTGFELHMSVTPHNETRSWSDIIKRCDQYLTSIDCTECLLHLHFSSTGSCPSSSSSHNTTVDITNIRKSLAKEYHQCLDGKGNFSSNGYPSIQLSLVDDKRMMLMTEIATDCFPIDHPFPDTISFRVRHRALATIHKLVEYHRYEVEYDIQQFESDGNVVIDKKIVDLYTREPPKNKKISSQDLLSNQLYGVDNTGNICVWPSEPLMLYLFTKSKVISDLVKDKRVLEVGGGMTGLAGLGLAALELCSEVLITDGHPHCVANQKSCIEMCRTKGTIREGFPITAEHLEWSSSSKTDKYWDVIIGIDCLFFKDCHDSLITLLLQMLEPNGLGLFFQPKRSGTMGLFVEKASLYFNVEIIENYSEEISQEDKTYLETDNSYDHEIHFPYLILLRKS